MQPTQFDIVADFGDLCGESPIWDPARATLFWTDISGRFFRACEWPGRLSKTLASDFEVCGFALNHDGTFVIGNSAGFWLWDAHSEPQPLLDTTGGMARGINDTVADPAGGMIAGTCFFQSDRDDYPRGHLLRLGTDGLVTVLDEGFGLANGLAFSPDCRTLYFADSAARIIYAYAYDAERGSVRDRRIFVKVPDDEGIPDGLTVDAEGFVWSAQWFGACIVRYDPDGSEERRISVPAKQSSSLTFGGPDLTDVFVTSAKFPDALPLAPRGFDHLGESMGGALFHANLGIMGKPEFVCRIARDR